MMDLIWFWCPAIIAACVIYACRTFTSSASIRRIQIAKKPAKTKRCGEATITSELNGLKELYFKLHNLERFYDDILPNVGSILFDMISETLDDAMLQESCGIFAIETYSRQSLEQFLRCEYDDCMRSWEKYNLRRQAGGDRELFVSREDASDSIRRLAPLRLVDGAWLSHVNKISTPIALRQITQKLWQILSEELGDGDLRKNHVHVYSKLIRATGGACPEPHSPFFIDPQHNMADVHVWKAAVAQQLISLFPDKFMPEMLGLNLHFEGIALETLIGSRELEELGYDPSYLLLHISIDNLHSGHSAIALETVTEYLDCVERGSGAEDRQAAWNRVRAGYVLSKHLNAATRQLRSPPATDLSPREETVLKIIVGKAEAAQKMHCRSRIMVGGHHIDHWLDKERLRERAWQMQFLQALGNTGSLVHRGRSADSRLVKEISWGGKMFGSFTDLEVTATKQWIDALPPKHGRSYRTIAGLRADKVAYDLRTDNQCWANAFYRTTPLITQALRDSNDTTFPFSTSINDMKVTQRPNLSRLLPLWFAGLSLLEHFVSVPSKAANNRTCAILRVLRAQHGLGVETGGVGGLDEALRSDRVDLIDIGLGWMDEAGLQRPQRVDAVLQAPDAVFARELSALAVRPEKHAEVLVGFSCAFAELHQVMVPLASPPLQDALRQIAIRERHGLVEWLADMQEVTTNRSTLCKAYNVGKEEIATLFT